MTQLQPKPVHLAGSISHGDWLPDDTITIPRQADPPLDGGASISAGDHAAAGGCSGFPIPESPPRLNAWQLVTGSEISEDGTIEDLEHLQALLERSPEIEGPMILGAMVRLRAALSALPAETAAEAPVSLPACDLVLIARALLRKLP